MDDALIPTDPEHPDANDAASATARLLMIIHHSRHDRTTDAESSGNGALMPAEMADAWAAVYIDVAEKIEHDEGAAESAAARTSGNDDSSK